MRIKLGSVAYLRAANSGYGIGLDDEGHRVEFLGDRHELALAALGEPIDVEDWQVLAVDEEFASATNPAGDGSAHRLHSSRVGRSRPA